MTPPLLPYRFREVQFRRWEDQIHTIVSNLPMVTKLDLHGLSPVTVQCRLRDAIRSFLDNHWDSILTGKEDLVRSIKVSERDGGLSAGNLDGLKLAEPGFAPSQHPSDMIYACVCLDEAKAVLIMVANKWLTSALVILVGPIVDDFLNVAKGYDVSLTHKQENIYLIT